MTMLVSHASDLRMGDWVAFWLFVLACVALGEWVRHRRDQAERKRWREWVREQDDAKRSDDDTRQERRR